MKVLVTRPAEDGHETARLLAQVGHEALLAPLLATRFLAGPEVDLAGVQAVLATSANGVRALARRTARRDVPLFAVGPQTAAMAGTLGFESVKSADGDAAALAKATQSWADPSKGALLHVAGEGNDGKLMQMLAGFTRRQEILYAVSAGELPAASLLALRQGEVDAALFFSPRSAAIFHQEAIRAELPLHGVIAVCISAATAAALAPLAFQEIRIAPRPNQDSLLGLIAA